MRPARLDLNIALGNTGLGVPSHDESHLFEMLTLEGAQAGLSWATILRKREGYRRAFSGFDPVVVERFDDRDVERLGHAAALMPMPIHSATFATTPSPQAA
jgi:DNA-3-methyladenine glycosylase I